MDALYTENIVTEKYGYSMTINLYQDIDAPNPFEECDTLGTLENCKNLYAYKELIGHLDAEKAVMVEGFTSGYESNDFVIYASRERIREYYNVKRLTKKVLEKAYDCLMEERTTYEKWLSGDVVGYVVTDDETGEDIDSCWGFYDDGYALEQAREAAESYRRPVPAWAKNWKLLPGLTAEQVGNPFLRVA